MRVLIIKTSSMGDVIHTLPALTDAHRALPAISFDWVVEKSFAEIPTWHPQVQRVIPVAIRQWRKKLFSTATRKEIADFYSQLRGQHYDLILDAQGLLKSVWIMFLAQGKKRAGYDWTSAREPIVSYLYQQKCKASWKWHAVQRLRALFSQALGYSLPNSPVDYGIDRTHLAGSLAQENYLVFLHGTTWITKHWPEQYWRELATLASQHHFTIKLPWGNEAELARAKRIAENCPGAEVLPRLKLAEIAKVLAGAKGIVAVDTGLAHLSAALAVPTVSLYGPTNPGLTGAMGNSQTHLAAAFSCAPCLGRTCSYRGEIITAIEPACFSALPPSLVWKKLLASIREN